MRQWRPRLEEFSREERPFEVGVPGRFEQVVGVVALRAPMHHNTDNWLIPTHCSNAFNTVKPAAVLVGTAT